MGYVYVLVLAFLSGLMSGFVLEVLVWILGLGLFWFEIGGYFRVWIIGFCFEFGLWIWICVYLDLRFGIDFWDYIWVWVWILGLGWYGFRGCFWFVLFLSLFLGLE